MEISIMLIVFIIIAVISFGYNFFKKKAILNLLCLILCVGVTFLVNKNWLFYHEEYERIKIVLWIFKLISYMELIATFGLVIINIKNKNKNCIWTSSAVLIAWFIHKVITDPINTGLRPNFETEISFNRQIYFETLTALFIQTNFFIATLPNENIIKLLKNRKMKENI